MRRKLCWRDGTSRSREKWRKRDREQLPDRLECIQDYSLGGLPATVLTGVASHLGEREQCRLALGNKSLYKALGDAVGFALRKQAWSCRQAAQWEAWDAQRAENKKRIKYNSKQCISYRM